MAKIEIDSDVICNLWKKLTGSEIEKSIFEEKLYKVLLPVVLLYDVRKDFIKMLSG